MKLAFLASCLGLAQIQPGQAAPAARASPADVPSGKRDAAQFANGQPVDGAGKGAPIVGKLSVPTDPHVCPTCQDAADLHGNGIGGTNAALDVQNPDSLGQQSTDAGVVPNLKWSFSDSKTRIFRGGWVREQVIQDLPSSHDIAGAQQHLVKGAIRELHWHRVVSLDLDHIRMGGGFPDRLTWRVLVRAGRMGLRLQRLGARIGRR